MEQVPYVKLSDLMPGYVYAITKYVFYYTKYGKPTIVLDLEGQRRVHLPEWFVNRHLSDYTKFFETHLHFQFHSMKQSKNNLAFQYADIEFPVYGERELFYNVKDMLVKFKGCVIEDCEEWEGGNLYDVTFKSVENGELVKVSLQLQL
jgi:hypothetical protein